MKYINYLIIIFYIYVYIKGAKKDSFTFGNEIYNFDGEEMGESLSKVYLILKIIIKSI